MNVASSILSTLAYHDIFDYPLDLHEIFDLLIKKKSDKESIARGLERLRVAGKVSENNGCFFLKGRRKIVRVRKLRIKYSLKKLKRAAFFAKLLRIVPSVKLVAVSGALSMKNSRKSDDIDLVIVTPKSLLWTTRLLANLLLLPFKRDPAGKKISDRACLNMFLDESALSIKDHNMYTAHEICQMKLLWDRDNTYSKFIRANSWIREYLPNWEADVKRLTTNDKRKKSPKALDFRRFALVIEPLEALAKWGQLWYMRNKLTTERISNTQLFFHPKDTQSWVIAEYQKGLKKLNIADP
ncbi:hypothetical protein A2W45_03505 [Candidatus Curtissbacteria bacterium RIFCSPHIGHO2_12_41_11]|uniref:Polymerase nucleotidyl transferase domain-containing protein n=2 Tax=Candidatus Curtissiibacteriota TaxID=1752717 RepID=A0A1F5H319_9BACT|nr:MAG: hypothetical protein A3D07_02995 [Candidatus Curtissbacteria bacterium RIFCSPHIGHO2_02_FULL_42_15]OGD98447.1 MAG: hypothetical protein A2W45_03505 [Candidatus Curtissbacteria bacterium RIFCSPHIGHO2_12_41_11]